MVFVTAYSFAAGGLFAVFFIAVFCIVLVSLCRGLAEWFRNNSAPVETVSAVIVRMRTADDSTVMTNADGTASVMGGTAYYVCFRTENGAEKEFRVKRSEYRSFREGMQGTLTFQGTRWHGFQPV
ncbi:MAG: DUF2500 domain-containing protein [Oscillospiraceae bacterium]|nr:DUF2500 domain-containing protein [Oscillospiraceae bacterium]MCR5305440.1 DUF2500 domain-containing protein [Oscillospiraceae bacterium]